MTEEDEEEKEEEEAETRAREESVGRCTSGVARCLLIPPVHFSVSTVKKRGVGGIDLAPSKCCQEDWMILLRPGVL